MSIFCDAVWVSASPSLRCLSMPLIKRLLRYANISGWEYVQSKDEAACMDTAVELLHDYLQTRKSPVHLVGHGSGGAIALIFARQYPQFVKSLTLLSVATQPANTWHVNYYQQRQIYTLTKAEALFNTIQNMFREEPICTLQKLNPQKLINQFDRDLENLPLKHSLFNIEKLPVGGVSMPLMICGGQVDPILSYLELYKWDEWLKPEDTVWKCPQGSHFFHYFYPDLVSKEISIFWKLQQNYTSKKDVVQT
ncbi:alpha/beta hydrolase [Mastigocoleus sp. MO_188.B34]|uniref:alpha/beta fold hydrolase n=1 Tax=Mastigocoleus sp. MO_188.B34 TaxID=3036635 RepID=UPI00260EB59C|nr:alpha/beta hydrolase [Mastigocoleus sp. MO_188.B34]MDJ0694843.1 alpha/beta hydrolase [Mastigocoleus sp. MO_188.B34]